MGSSPRLFVEWFTHEAPFADAPHVSCFAEIEGARGIIDSALQSLIIDHLIGADLLSRLIDHPAAALGAAERVPKSAREMSGDFGEVLAAAYVEECSDFRIPIRRLRYKADREFPMQGDDIIALAEGEPARLLKGEAKSRQSLDVSAVRDADGALNSRDGRPKPETLGFLSMRLRELEEDEFAEKVEVFLDACDDGQLEHLLFTVSANDRRDLLRDHADSERPSIQRRATGVVISDHGEFIASVFERVRGAVSSGGA